MKTIIRKSSLNLNYATNLKKDKLDSILLEYKRVVNLYISALFQVEKLNLSALEKAATWLSARMQQCAGKQAIGIVRSNRTITNKRRYKRYKKAYKYFKQHKRQLEFLSKKYKELNITKYRKLPVYNGNVMELDERFIEIQQSKTSKEYDIWFKFTSIGDSIKLVLPSKKHMHFNIFSNWQQLKSTRIRKTNGVFYIDLFFTKEVQELSPQGKAVGIDLGINKLITTSDNVQLGKEFKPILNKLKGRKQKSKGWHRTLAEIKNYIGNQVNNLDLTNINRIILESLKGIEKNTKQDRKLGKETRQLLSKWNRLLVFDRISSRADFNRIEVCFVDPKNTSRQCSICGDIREANRECEIFKCKNCGYTIDADYNASLNILSRYKPTGAYSPCVRES